MSFDFRLSIFLKDTVPYKNFCPKVLDNGCDFYDQWEPTKECLTNNGKNCNSQNTKAKA
jgi:hypothetical protein